MILLLFQKQREWVDDNKLKSLSEHRLACIDVQYHTTYFSRNDDLHSTASTWYVTSIDC